MENVNVEKKGRGRPRQFTDEERKAKELARSRVYRAAHSEQYRKYHREYYHKKKQQPAVEAE